MQIGRYLVERELGQGGLGTVFLADDPKLHRKVAIKRLRAESDAEVKRRFQLEIKAITTLKHRNIVELYDYSDEDAAEIYFVMEYIPGHALHSILDSRGPMSEETTLCIGLQLATALEHAHERGIVHRDIKPENVMLHDGRVVLLDFGALKVFKNGNQLGVQNPPDQTIAVGTPGFMAPEQFEGRNIDPRTDIFAVGAVLYHCATNALPYHGSNLDDADEQYAVTKRGHYRDPRDYQPLLSVEFCELLAECLTPRPNQRLPTAAELVKRIEPMLQARGVTDPVAHLRDYEVRPATHEQDQLDDRVDRLTRDLKLALLRDLQVAVRDKHNPQARTALRQLEQLSALEEVGKGRRRDKERTFWQRRRAFFVMGALVGALAAFVSHLFAERWGSEPSAEDEAGVSRE